MREGAFSLFMYAYVVLQLTLAEIAESSTNNFKSVIHLNKVFPVNPYARTQLIRR